MNLKKLLITFSIISTVIIGCNDKDSIEKNQNSTTISKSTENMNVSTDLNRLSSWKMDTKTYLIYTVSNDSNIKNITVPLFFDISKLNIKNVSLISNNKTVMDNVAISAVHENKLTLTFQRFITNFDHMKVTLANGKEIVLDTGQYYLEKFTDDSINQSKLLTLKEYHDTFTKGEYSLEAVLSKNKESKVDYLVPEKARHYIKDIKFEKKDLGTNNQYTLKFKIDKKLLTDNNIKEASIDLALIQKSDNEKWSLVKGSIPIEMSDYN